MCVVGWEKRLEYIEEGDSSPIAPSRPRVDEMRARCVRLRRRALFCVSQCCAVSVSLCVLYATFIASLRNASSSFLCEYMCPAAVDADGPRPTYLILRLSFPSS